MNRHFETDLQMYVQMALDAMAPGTTFIQRKDGALALDGPEPPWVQEKFPPFDPFPFASEGPAIRLPRFVLIPEDVQRRYDMEVAEYRHDIARLNAERQRRERQLENEVARLRPLIDDLRPVLTLWYITSVWWAHERQNEHRSHPEHIWHSLTTSASIHDIDSGLEWDNSGLIDTQLPSVLEAFETRDRFALGATKSAAHYCALETALNDLANAKESENNEILSEDQEATYNQAIIEPQVLKERFMILMAGWNDTRFVDMLESWYLSDTDPIKSYAELFDRTEKEYSEFESKGMIVPPDMRVTKWITKKRVVRGMVQEIDPVTVKESFGKQFRRRVRERDKARMGPRG